MLLTVVGGLLFLVLVTMEASTTEGQAELIGAVPWIGERISGLAHSGPITYAYLTTYGGETAYVSGKTSLAEFRTFADTNGLGMIGDALASDFSSKLEDHDLDPSKFACRFPDGFLSAIGRIRHVHVWIVFRESDGAFLIQAQGVSR